MAVPTRRVSVASLRLRENLRPDTAAAMFKFFRCPACLRSHMSDDDANREMQHNHTIPQPPSSPISRINDLILRAGPPSLITSGLAFKTGSATSTIQDEAKEIIKTTAPCLEELWYSLISFSDGLIEASRKADSEDPQELVDSEFDKIPSSEFRSYLYSAVDHDVRKLYPELIQRTLVMAAKLRIEPMGCWGFGHQTPVGCHFMSKDKAY